MFKIVETIKLVLYIPITYYNQNYIKYHVFVDNLFLLFIFYLL